MTINTWLWLAQIGEFTSIFGMLTFMFVGMALLYVSSLMSLETCPAPPALKLKKTLRNVCVAAMFVGLLGVTIPNSDTILYSMALEHGPEYVERLMAVIEEMDR